MKKIGPYEFEGTLGRGGMGTVFRGKHLETGEIHAVKVLSPVYSHDDHFRGRFESEINALLQLDHPNIVRLISYGQEDGNLYFSMELIEGNSLFQIQKKGHQFNWREVLQVAKDVCQGLRHAHDRGIIHRDLKPGNLLMTPLKTVKLTDFGIAKSFGTNQNTGDNILGTMDFMSPEQAKGEPVTFRSDLYSLGAVMFTLLSGRPPFTANSIEESLRNLTRVPAPRIGSKVPGIPPDIDAIIAKLMEKKPQKRIATALALHHKLEAIESSLKTYSEAKTAETGNPGTSSDDEEKKTLFVDQDMATIAHFTDHSTSDSSSDVARVDSGNPTRADKTVIEDAHVRAQKEVRTGNDSNRRSNFHNRVNVKERVAALDPTDDDPIEAQYGKGILPTLLMLLAVVSISTVWTWSSLKAPSAEQLYTQITSQPPSQVIEQCERFIETYPDAEEQKAETVRRIYEFGKATKYYTQLSNRLKGKRGLLGEEELTEIERDFLEIAELAETDFEQANILMDAFITFHDHRTDLSPRDSSCIEAAKSYLQKIREDAIRRAKTKLDSISNALARATRQAPLDAIKTYRSIIELYDKMNKTKNPEVRELVEQAKKRLVDLEAKEDSILRTKSKLESVTNAMLKAAQQEPLDAIKTYQSIIQLHGDANATETPALKALIEKAQQRLGELESKAEQEPEGDSQDE